MEDKDESFFDFLVGMYDELKEKKKGE